MVRLDWARSLAPRAWMLGLALVGLLMGLLVARLPLATLALAVVSVGLVVGAAMEPLVGIGGALVLGPLRAWLEIRAPGVMPYVGQVVLVLALTAWLVRRMLARDVQLRLPLLLGPLLAFLGVALLSLWRPVDIWHGFLELAKWVQVALVMLVVADRLEGGWSDQRVCLVVGALGAAGLLQALIGLWQFGLRGEGVAQFVIRGRFYRAYGTFQQPNPFAGLLGMMGAVFVGLAAGIIVEQWRTGGSLLSAAQAALPVAIPASLLLAGLGASWSRGGWMGLGVALLVMVVLLPRRPLWGVALVGALLVGGVVLYTLGRLPAAVVERLVGFFAYARFEDVRGVGITDANFAVIERMAHWQAALYMWRDRFWLGLGIGGYEAAYPAYRLINWPLALGHAHNFYLNLLAEVGVLGLGAYLVWIGLIFVRLLQALPLCAGWRRGLAIGLVGAWTHLAVHSMVDHLLVNNVHLHVGVMAALSAWVISCAAGCCPDGNGKGLVKG